MKRLFRPINSRATPRHFCQQFVFKEADKILKNSKRLTDLLKLIHFQRPGSGCRVQSGNPL